MAVGTTWKSLWDDSLSRCVYARSSRPQTGPDRSQSSGMVPFIKITLPYCEKKKRKKKRAFLSKTWHCMNVLRKSVWTCLWTYYHIHDVKLTNLTGKVASNYNWVLAENERIGKRLTNLMCKHVLVDDTSCIFIFFHHPSGSIYQNHRVIFWIS